MGVRYPSVFSTTFVGPWPANATETIICTLPPLILPIDGATVFIHWWDTLTYGTGTTAINYRIRRGTNTSGQIVGVAAAARTVVAGNTDIVYGCYFDVPGAVTAQQYILTGVQTGATAGAVNNDICMFAYAL